MGAQVGVLGVVKSLKFKIKSSKLRKMAVFEGGVAVFGGIVDISQ